MGGCDGGSPGHFDRANCLNPQALFAMLCAVLRRYSPLLCNESLSLPFSFGRNSLSTPTRVLQPLRLVTILSVATIGTIFHGVVEQQSGWKRREGSATSSIRVV